MSNKKCNCINSKLFPHRADKCTFAKKKSSNNNSDNKKDTNVSSVPVAEVVTPLDDDDLEDEVAVGKAARVVDSVKDEQETQQEEIEVRTAALETTACVDDAIDESTSSSIDCKDKEGEDTIEVANNKLPDGDAQCNCMMQKIKKHRKKNCRWKKHAAIAIGVTVGVVAAVAVGVAIAAASGDGNSDGNSQDSSSDTVNTGLTSGVEGLKISNEEQEAQARAQAEERERREAAEAEQRRRDQAAEAEQRRRDQAATAAAAEQQRRLEAERAEREEAEYHLELQRRENERLRLAMLEQQRQQQLEMDRLRAAQQSMPRTVFISVPPSTSASSYYGSSSRSTTSGSSYAKYGTTQQGTTCKNCIKVGGRCHQHR